LGGHPRTLEYLDALLRGGEARFPDVEARLRRALKARKDVDQPEKWMAGVAGDLDAALAEVVTLAVDDVVLGELLDRLEDQSLARRLLIGASVYRLPVDEIGLVWQVGEEREVEEDPEREARRVDFNERARKAQVEGRRVDRNGLGYSEAEWAQLERDQREHLRPPVKPPEDLAEALKALLDLGLLSPVMGSGEQLHWLVHRWTARALASLVEQEVLEAHQRAARYWRWRVERWPQPAQADLDQLVEARYHHREAGELEEALGITDQLDHRLRLAGAYRSAEQLHREALAWVPEGSRFAAVAMHQIGLLAQERGDYDEALDWYRKALEIDEQLGNRAGMASTISQLGILATKQERPEEAVPLNLRSLSLRLEIGSPEAWKNLAMLTRQREMLGDERFRELLAEHAGEEGRDNVLELMAQYEETRRQAEGGD